MLTKLSVETETNVRLHDASTFVLQLMAEPIFRDVYIVDRILYRTEGRQCVYERAWMNVHQRICFGYAACIRTEGRSDNSSAYVGNSTVMPQQRRNAVKHLFT